MNINQIIPDNNSNWVVKKNILYYHKYCLIPVANYIDDSLFISLDKRCLKAVTKLIMNCENLGLDFLFCDKYQLHEKNIYQENIPNILSANLMCLSDPKFFDLVQKGRLDFLGKLILFIERYDCFKDFKIIWKKLNTLHFDRSYFDYFANRNIYLVQRQDIRDYFNSLEREINIMMLLH